MSWSRAEKKDERAEHKQYEMPHRQRIGRKFALAAHEVTVDQFRR